MSSIFYYFLIINILGFIITGIDKWLAVKNQNRISEKKLFSLALAGGTIGALVAIQVFRHKTQKAAFMLIVYGILILQLALLYFSLDFFKSIC